VKAYIGAIEALKDGVAYLHHFDADPDQITSEKADRIRIKAGSGSASK
jgi:hypothetical protein